MSMRSIIEINHDYIHELREAGHISDELFRWLSDDHWREKYSMLRGSSGLRYLRLRHHSETVELTVE